MSNTRKLALRSTRDFALGKTTAVLTLCLPLLAHAEIKLSSDWDSTYTCTGSARTNAELAEIQQGLRPMPICTKRESEKVDEATARSAIARSAALDRTQRKPRGYKPERGFKLQMDGRQHYLDPVLFMTKSHPNEICTPSSYEGQPTYRCDEGQRYTLDCHILIFNDKFEEVGYHRILVKEPYQFYCNAVPGIGVADAANNLLLATVQYFPIDRKHASTIAEVGQGWRRMTVALRLKRQEDGRVLIEQEDNCLGNPNGFETIPDARRHLKQCAANRH